MLQNPDSFVFYFLLTVLNECFLDVHDYVQYT